VKFNLIVLNMNKYHTVLPALPVITYIPCAEEMGPKWGLNQLGRPKNLQEQLLSVVPQLHHFLLPAMKRINYICTSKLNLKNSYFTELAQQSQHTDSYRLNNAVGTEVTKGWSYTSSRPICLHGVDRDQFSFTLILLFLLAAKWSTTSEWFHVLHILLIFWGLQIFINSSQRKNYDIKIFSPYFNSITWRRRRKNRSFLLKSHNSQHRHVWKKISILGIWGNINAFNINTLSDNLFKIYHIQEVGSYLKKWAPCKILYLQAQHIEFHFNNI